MSGESATGLRVTGAALAAVLAAAGAAALHAGVQALLHDGPVVPVLLLVGFFAILFAAAHLVIAIPAYLLLRRFGALTWWRAAIGGWLIGVIPMALFSLDPSYETYQSGQAMLVVDGAYTAAGWRSWAQSAATTGINGLIGGLAFWAVLQRSQRVIAG